jgi:phytol kinase
MIGQDAKKGMRLGPLWCFMRDDLLGLVLSLGFIGLVLFASGQIASRLGLSGEALRKMVHIGVSNWWLIAGQFFHSPWLAAAVPALFIVVNAIPERLPPLKTLQNITDKTRKGTVYYPISLAILALLCFGPLKSPALGAFGVLCMGYGDGLAAVIGQRLGKRRFRVFGAEKSVAGCAAMLLVSLLACYFTAFFYGLAVPPYIPAILAVFALILELFTPFGLDNLTVPLGVTALAFALVH